MFILRAKRNKQGKGIKARDDRIVFHHRHRVFGSGAAAPQKLEKEYESRRQPCPCRYRLALTLHRKMNVDGSKNAMRTRTVSLQASQRGCRVSWDIKAQRGLFRSCVYGGKRRRSVTRQKEQC